MKYKYLTKEQIIISIDRLTRFKNTKEKYLRVYKDIISTNLIEPVIKKKDIENIDLSELTEFITEIFNNSLNKLLDKHCQNNNYINVFLKKYENSIFNNDNETQKLLDNKINYYEAINLINEKSPINLAWLKELANLQKLNDINKIKEIREHKLLKFPIEEIILAEGITEEILLPSFSRYLGYDFYAKGIQIIPAGGKNQVVKKYYELAEQVKIPIFVLLDKDAEENIKQIEPKLRKIDRIHLVSCGEFEDLLPKTLIIKTLNCHLKNFTKIDDTEFDIERQTVKQLEEIFKKKGLSEFKKSEFAKMIKDNITTDTDISIEIKSIIQKIKKNNK